MKTLDCAPLFSRTTLLTLVLGLFPLLAHCGGPEDAVGELDSLDRSSQALGRVRCNHNYECRDVGGETVGLKVRMGAFFGGAKVKVFERPRRRDDVEVDLQTFFFKNGECVCNMEEKTVGNKTTRTLISGDFKLILGVEGECDPYFEDCSVTGPTGSASAKKFPFDGVYARARVKNDGDRETIEGWEGNANSGVLCFNPCF